MSITRTTRIPRWKVPSAHRSWVFDQGSLTKRLVETSAHNFRVRVTFQGWAVPSSDERRVLAIKERQMALVREVELLCYEQVWVVARSVIPAQTLTGSERQLKYLGDKPLGAFLFRSRVMSRSTLESVFSDFRGVGKVYGRRSVFNLRHKPLLVSELFMPRVFQHSRLR